MLTYNQYSLYYFINLIHTQKCKTLEVEKFRQIVYNFHYNYINAKAEISMPIFAIILYAFIVVPLIYLAVGLRRAKEYCEKRGWLLLATFFETIGYPLRLFENVF